MAKTRPVALKSRAEWPHLPDVTLHPYADLLRREKPDADSVERVYQIIGLTNELLWQPGFDFSRGMHPEYNFLNTMIHEFRNDNVIAEIRKRTIDAGMRTDPDKRLEDLKYYDSCFDEIVNLFGELFAEHPKPWKEHDIKVDTAINKKYYPLINRQLIHILGDGRTPANGESYSGNDILRLGYVPHEDMGDAIMAQDLCSLFGIESEIREAYCKSKAEFESDLDGELGSRKHAYLTVNHPEVGCRRYDPVLQLRHFYSDYPEHLAAMYRNIFTNNPGSKTVWHLRRREKNGKPRMYADMETVRTYKLSLAAVSN